MKAYFKKVVASSTSTPQNIGILGTSNMNKDLYSEPEMGEDAEYNAIHVEEYPYDNKKAQDIRKMLNRVDTPPSSKHCIYRAPEKVRSTNVAAYTPQVVSIGPYHRDDRRLVETEGLKRSYCNKLIERSKKSLNDIIEHLEGARSEVCDCYEETNPFYDLDDYLNVILLDACFIIEHLIRSRYPELRDHTDCIPSMHLQRTHIKHDLVLLENQLPYFVLESLFNLLDPSFMLQRKMISPKFSDLVMSFFTPYNTHVMVPDFDSVKHFTDLIRTLHKPKEQSWYPGYSDFEFTANATQLYGAGVEFKRISGGKCLLDVVFKENFLELPSFELNDDRESLYRNLMALELCHYPTETFIIDYFVFMDTLINTSDDISLLVQARVLVNRIGDYRDAANTFNKFCAGITTYNATKSYLRPVYGKLNAYYKKPKHTWMTTFKRDYFGTPLRTASTITAVSLVVLTFISTVCAIISVI